MGLIGAPSLYLDTCVFIAAFEDAGDARTPARLLLDKLIGERDLAITSELTLAELLAPSEHARMSVADRRRLYLRLFDEVQAVRLVPVTRKVLLETVELREQHPHRIPDAIHLATAIGMKCSHFMSFDRDARRRPPGIAWLTPNKQDVDAFFKAANA